MDIIIFLVSIITFFGTWYGIRKKSLHHNKGILFSVVLSTIFGFLVSIVLSIVAVNLFVSSTESEKFKHLTELAAGIPTSILIIFVNVYIVIYIFKGIKSLFKSKHKLESTTENVNKPKPSVTTEIKNKFKLNKKIKAKYKKAKPVTSSFTGTATSKQEKSKNKKSQAKASASSQGQYRITYIDSNYNRTTRDITIVKVEQDRIQAFCHTKNGLRTFKTDSIQGNIISLDTGEIISKNIWIRDIA